MVVAIIHGAVAELQVFPSVVAQSSAQQVGEFDRSASPGKAQVRKTEDSEIAWLGFQASALRDAIVKE